MHIEHIDIKIVSCDAQTFKHLQMKYHMTYKARKLPQSHKGEIWHGGVDKSRAKLYLRHQRPDFKTKMNTFNQSPNIKKEVKEEKPSIKISELPHTHTHTQTFNGLFSRTTWKSQYFCNFRIAN